MSTVQRLAEVADAQGWNLIAGSTVVTLTKDEKWIRILLRKDGKIHFAYHGSDHGGQRTRIVGGWKYVFRAMQRISPGNELTPELTPERRRSYAQKVARFKAWPKDPVEVCLIATAAWGPFSTDRQRYAACIRGLKEAGLL